jgi:hypothetical protein
VHGIVGELLPLPDPGDATFDRGLADAYDQRARLGEIGWPTQVIVGERDWRTPPSASRTIAAGIPGAELLVLPDVGHFPYVEVPEALAAAVRQFMEPPLTWGQACSPTSHAGNRNRNALRPPYVPNHAAAVGDLTFGTSQGGSGGTCCKTGAIPSSDKVGPIATLRVGKRALWPSQR